MRVLILEPGQGLSEPGPWRMLSPEDESSQIMNPVELDAQLFPPEIAPAFPVRPLPCRSLHCIQHPSHPQHPGVPLPGPHPSFSVTV